jgi:sugar/nucleoside kinase (ribokinase family)
LTNNHWQGPKFPASFIIQQLPIRYNSAMSGQTGDKPPDYLIIGHITQDQQDQGYQIGGSAVYSGVLAHRFGLKVAVYTSGASDLSLDIMQGIEIIDQPSPGRTTFINTYTPSGRVQKLLDKAEELDCSQIPEQWKQAEIIHLAPVAREVPDNVEQEFPSGFLVYSLQGWLRDWDEEGLIFSSSPPELRKSFRDNAVGILSMEDLGHDRSGIDQLQRQFPTLVLTLGSEGVEIHTDGKTLRIPAPSTPVIDPTGAGDIFAAAFVIFWKIKGMTIEESAQIANMLAAGSIRKPGISGIPERREINQIIGVQE